MGMDVRTHWEKIYTEKAVDAVSWYRPHLETSLALIERMAAGCSPSIIDVGGGESTLVDDLLARGYQNITVLDVSQTAIDANRKRLGKAAHHVHWLVADITDCSPLLTMCGTTVLSFIFLLRRATVSPTSAKSPTR
jgi:2-polyprenyl-3-methyl-5-hydroxy-6-metoxy-1,4-benzoquinol methylase